MGFPGSSDGKESTCNVGDVGSIPGGKIPWRKDGNPLQDSCLENPMDRGVWRVTVHRVTKESDMTEQISTAQHIGKEEMLQHIHDA